jgi:FSR family fosmidomycin resistance protein-like MFS transporter
MGMSFYMTGGELARAVGPLAAVGTVSLLGLEGFYPVMIVGIVASFWLLLRLRGVTLEGRQRQPASVRQTWREMRFLLVPLTAILFFRGFMHASVATFLPTYIQLETGNLWLAGIGLTVFEAAGVAGVLAAGSFSDRFGRRRILLISLTGAPISLLLFIWLEGWLRFGALLFVGLTVLSTTPVMLALIQEHAKRSPSTANGFYMMISFIARSAIVVVVGFIGDLIGLRATYFVSALLGMMAIPFILRLPKRR